MDYETINPAVPPFNGIRPYQQLPFQFFLFMYEKALIHSLFSRSLGNTMMLVSPLLAL
ncbi:MAG: DUF2779 domain-containing protein [Rhizobiales bacterium]|nr:DUF2779 domain-containing protein [Hyphomicrobiales bacterium]